MCTSHYLLNASYRRKPFNKNSDSDFSIASIKWCECEYAWIELVLKWTLIINFQMELQYSVSHHLDLHIAH